MSTALHPAWPVPAVRTVQGPDSPAAVAVAGAGRGLSGALAGRRVMLRYREPGRVLVRGPVTGRPYEFSAARPTQWVEARDAEALLSTRRFMRA